jgi:hypothetical protein
MKFIAHRGNMSGPNPARENSPDYIDEAIKAGCMVEVDLRRVGSNLFFGHDYPQYKVKAEWIEDRKKSLLLHLKDFQAAKATVEWWHTFCHVSDPYTLTSEGKLWLHDLSIQPDENTIVPLLSKELVQSYGYRRLYAICSDWKVNEMGLLC